MYSLSFSLLSTFYVFEYCHCVPKSHFPDKQAQFFQSFPYLRLPSLVWILLNSFISFLVSSTQNGHNSPAEALREERWSGRTTSNRPTKTCDSFQIKCGSWWVRRHNQSNISKSSTPYFPTMVEDSALFEKQSLQMHVSSIM